MVGEICGSDIFDVTNQVGTPLLKKMLLVVSPSSSLEPSTALQDPAPGTDCPGGQGQSIPNASGQTSAPTASASSTESELPGESA